MKVTLDLDIDTGQIIDALANHLLAKKIDVLGDIVDAVVENVDIDDVAEKAAAAIDVSTDKVLAKIAEINLAPVIQAEVRRALGSLLAVKP